MNNRNLINSISFNSVFTKSEDEASQIFANKENKFIAAYQDYDGTFYIAYKTKDNEFKNLAVSPSNFTNEFLTDLYYLKRNNNFIVSEYEYLNILKFENQLSTLSTTLFEKEKNINFQTENIEEQFTNTLPIPITPFIEYLNTQLNNPKSKVEISFAHSERTKVLDYNADGTHCINIHINGKKTFFPVGSPEYLHIMDMKKNNIISFDIIENEKILSNKSLDETFLYRNAREYASTISNINKITRDLKNAEKKNTKKQTKQSKNPLAKKLKQISESFKKRYEKKNTANINNYEQICMNEIYCADNVKLDTISFIVDGKSYTIDNFNNKELYDKILLKIESENNLSDEQFSEFTHKLPNSLSKNGIYAINEIEKTYNNINNQFDKEREIEQMSIKIDYMLGIFDPNIFTRINTFLEDNNLEYISKFKGDMAIIEKLLNNPNLDKKFYNSFSKLRPLNEKDFQNRVKLLELKNKIEQLKLNQNSIIKDFSKVDTLLKSEPAFEDMKKYYLEKNKSANLPDEMTEEFANKIENFYKENVTPEEIVNTETKIKNYNTVANENSVIIENLNEFTLLLPDNKIQVFSLRHDEENQIMNFNFLVTLLKSGNINIVCPNKELINKIEKITTNKVADKEEMHSKNLDEKLPPYDIDVEIKQKHLDLSQAQQQINNYFEEHKDTNFNENEKLIIKELNSNLLNFKKEIVHLNIFKNVILKKNQLIDNNKKLAEELQKVNQQAKQQNVQTTQNTNSKTF